MESLAGIDLILSSPFYLLIFLLTLYFLMIIVYTLNNSLEPKYKYTDKLDEKIVEASEKYEVDVIQEKNPVLIFVMLLALIVYNIIAWFVKDSMDKVYFDKFYEFFSGFVVFLLVSVAWSHLSTFLTRLFFRQHPSLDVRTYLKERSNRLILKYTLFTTLVYNVLLPLILFIIVIIVYPTIFLIGGLTVLIIGLIQNLWGLYKISK